MADCPQMRKPMQGFQVQISLVSIRGVGRSWWVRGGGDSVAKPDSIFLTRFLGSNVSGSQGKKMGWIESGCHMGPNLGSSKTCKWLVNPC